jgi:hypothetical protein
MGCSKSRKGEIYSIELMLEKEKKSKTNCLNFCLNKIKSRRERSVQRNQKKRNNKREVNEIKIRKSIGKIKETKSWVL